MIPTGTQYTLAAGDYAAVVTEVGATLRELTFRGSPVAVGFGEDEPMQRYRGAILAPWPNRIGDGRYSFGGREHQVPLNEIARGNALHGLVAFLPWSLLAATASSVELAVRIWPQPGYEFIVDLVATYALDADRGLSITLRATNAGDVPAPYGSSIHPYLVAGAGRVDDWQLSLPADTFIEVDATRLLPTGDASVAGTDFDFRAPRVIGTTFIDHAFTGLHAGADGQIVARITTADGHGAEVEWSAAECPWIQVHTADSPDTATSRIGLALEPMTCPPDSFRSGVGLISLSPGDSHEATWHLRALTP